jgi:hypothetical protein
MLIMMEMKKQAIIRLKAGESFSLDRENHDELTEEQIRFLMSVERGKKLDEFLIMVKNTDGEVFLDDYEDFFEKYRVGGGIDYLSTFNEDRSSGAVEIHIFQKGVIWQE